MPRPIRLSPKQRKRWARYVAGFAREIGQKLPYPVRVRTVPNQQWSGEVTVASCNGRRWYELRVSSYACYLLRIDTLVHEYAHLLQDPTWHEKHIEHEHCDTWGVAYARCYRIQEKLYEEMPAEIKD